MGVSLTPSTSVMHEQGKRRHNELVNGIPEKGLTTWGIRAASCWSRFADDKDRASGYAGQSLSAAGSDPYSVAGSSEPAFLVAPLGFTEMIRRLRALCERSGARIVTGATVAVWLPV